MTRLGVGYIRVIWGSDLGYTPGITPVISWVIASLSIGPVATILHAIYDQKRVLNSMTKKRYKNYYLGDLQRVLADLFAAFEACQLKPPFFTPS
jgi:hypothetical protein